MPTQAHFQTAAILSTYMHAYTLLSIPKKGFSASISKLNEINKMDE